MLKLLRLATRNLTRNRRRTLLSLSALVVGVGVMVALRAFMNGQQLSMLEGTLQGTVGMIQVHKRGYLANVQALPLTFDMPDTPQLRAQLASVPGVIGVAPRIIFGAMVSTPDAAVEGRELKPEEQGQTSYFTATAIDPEAEHRVTPKRWDWVGQGRIFDRADAAELVLNGDFNAGLLAPVHPARDALPPETEWPALLAGDRDGSLNGANVVLVGTQVSAAPGDRKVGLVPLATAQKVLRMEGRVTEYAIRLNNVDDAPQIRDQLQALLGPSYEVNTWDEIIPFMKTLLTTFNRVYSGITAVFLGIVFLGIVNTLLMNVLERVREIGTMLAVGMRRSQIVSLFVFEGLVLGFVGGIAGVIVGYVLTAFLHHRGIQLPAPGSQVTQTIRPFVAGSYLLLAIAVSSLGAAASALYPAYRASKLRPVEALASL